MGNAHRSKLTGTSSLKDLHKLQKINENIADRKGAESISDGRCPSLRSTSLLDLGFTAYSFGCYAHLRIKRIRFYTLQSGVIRPQKPRRLGRLTSVALLEERNRFGDLSSIDFVGFELLAQSIGKGNA